MKPYKIILFIALCIGLLVLVSSFFPPEGYNVGSLRLSFPNLTEFLEKQRVSAATIDEPSPEELLQRQLAEMRSQEEGAFLRFFTENSARMHLPNNDLAFFDALFERFEKATEQSVRIVHYGDSQIEEDRISNILRESLQKRFGGSGSGLLPLYQTIPSTTMQQTISDYPTRYVVYGDSTQRVQHRRYGPMGQAAMVHHGIQAAFNARNPKKKRENPSQHFSKATLLVGEIGSEALQVTINGNTKTISPSDKSQAILFQLKDSSTTAKLELVGDAEIFGLLLDGAKGVSVDNVPMRGCSGTIFTRIDKEGLQSYFGKQQVGLIILQFGGNSVPYLKTDNAIAKYKNDLIRQINHLKALAPKARFLFIGPSDMSTRIDGQMVTYPKLPDLIEQLKAAAQETNIAYWSLFDVMGGQNSMPKWVQQQPSLAASDHIHFSRLGATKVGQLLYESLMRYYDYYVWRRENKEEKQEPQVEPLTK